MEKFEIGVERLACAMRYANPAWVANKSRYITNLIQNAQNAQPIPETSQPQNPPQNPNHTPVVPQNQIQNAPPNPEITPSTTSQNPSQITIEAPVHPQKRPIKEITKNFDKNLKPPPMAIPEIEKKIKNMKNHMEPLKK